MRKKSFFDNLGAILAYALLGTIISTAIIALGDHPYITSELFGPTQGTHPPLIFIVNTVLSGTNNGHFQNTPTQFIR